MSLTARSVSAAAPTSSLHPRAGHSIRRRWNRECAGRCHRPCGRRIHRQARPGQGVDDACRHRSGAVPVPSAGWRHRDEWRFGGQHDVRRRFVRGSGRVIGKVSDDELGRVFGHDCRAVGVHSVPGAPAYGTPTGRCIIVVTPDAQRTMNTYLGVSSLLAPGDVDADRSQSARFCTWRATCTTGPRRRRPSVTPPCRPCQ